MAGLLQINSVMDKYSNIRTLNFEKVTAMEEGDKEVHGESENSNSDFSDNDRTYMPSSRDTHSMRIQSLYSSDSGSESEEEVEDTSRFYKHHPRPRVFLQH